MRISAGVSKLGPDTQHRRLRAAGRPAARRGALEARPAGGAHRHPSSTRTARRRVSPISGLAPDRLMWSRDQRRDARAGRPSSAIRRRWSGSAVGMPSARMTRWACASRRRRRSRSNGPRPCMTDDAPALHLARDEPARMARDAAARESRGCRNRESTTGSCTASATPPRPVPSTMPRCVGRPNFGCSRANACRARSGPRQSSRRGHSWRGPRCNRVIRAPCEAARTRTAAVRRR